MTFHGRYARALTSENLLQAYVRTTIASLLQNKVDISELIITKQLNKTEENAKNQMAHVVLAKKMKDRDPNTAPHLGERIPYVIITATNSQKSPTYWLYIAKYTGELTFENVWQGPKGAKAFEKAEDPIYVLENNIPIDMHWYVEHQLMNPILRLFEAISDNPKSLLSGINIYSMIYTI